MTIIAQRPRPGVAAPRGISVASFYADRLPAPGLPGNSAAPPPGKRRRRLSVIQNVTVAVFEQVVVPASHTSYV